MFFRTNRGTCEEWLLRLRRSALLLGLHVDAPAVTLRHAAAALTDLAAQGNAQVCVCACVCLSVPVFCVCACLEVV